MGFFILIQLIYPNRYKTLAQVFSCEFCEISKNTYFTEHLWTTAYFSALLKLVQITAVKPVRCYQKKRLWLTYFMNYQRDKSLGSVFLCFIRRDSKINFFTKNVKLTSWGWVGLWYDVFQKTAFYQFQKIFTTIKTRMFDN